MTTKIKSLMAGGVLAAATLTGAIATSASASEPAPTPASVEAGEARMANRFGQLTSDQMGCLQDAGLSRPADRSGPPSLEDRQTLSDAAADCGLEIPAEAGQRGERGRPGVGEGRPEAATEGAQDRMSTRFEALSDDQSDCLTDAGLAQPADRTGPPTAEQRQELLTAAEDCGLDIPTQGRGGGPGY